MKIMTEQDILNLIQKDEWMMKVLKIAEQQKLKDWVIGAGFVRNKIWDYLHGFKNKEVDTNDIDLVYFDKDGNNKEKDKKLSQQLSDKTKINWQIKNQFYMHEKNNLPPYKSTIDALSKWTETATGIGVKIKNNKLTLVAPNGINDLVNLVVRPSPKFPESIDIIKQRVKDKKWLEKWPKLKVEL